MERKGRPVESDAARDLIEKALKPSDEPLYVLTIGCPVNVSSAIVMEPRIKEKIVVVWLGGTTHYWPSASEFNLRQDVIASQVLFDSGVPLVQIPTKNVSEHLKTTASELEQFLRGRSRIGDYLYGQFLQYQAVRTKGRNTGFPYSKVIWDISAIAWLNNPRLGPLGDRVKPRVDRRHALEDRIRSAQHPRRKQLQPRLSLQRCVQSARRPQGRWCVAGDCNSQSWGRARSEREGVTMASITIRHLDDEVKTRLRVRASANGRSMEEEARIILREAVGREAEPENLASFIRECFEPVGGVEFEVPPREPMREPPAFS